MAIVNNTNLKRAPHSPESRDHPSKYIKIDHDSRGEKKETELMALISLQSIDE